MPATICLALPEREFRSGSALNLDRLWTPTEPGRIAGSSRATSGVSHAGLLDAFANRERLSECAVSERVLVVGEVRLVPDLAAAASPQAGRQSGP